MKKIKTKQHEQRFRQYRPMDNKVKRGKKLAFWKKMFPQKTHKQKSTRTK